MWKQTLKHKFNNLIKQKPNLNALSSKNSDILKKNVKSMMDKSKKLTANINSSKFKVGWSPKKLQNNFKLKQNSDKIKNSVKAAMDRSKKITSSMIKSPLFVKSMQEGKKKLLKDFNPVRRARNNLLLFMCCGIFTFGMAITIPGEISKAIRDK